MLVRGAGAKPLKICTAIKFYPPPKKKLTLVASMYHMFIL